ncbi:unnamed protein product [Calicophoron daubneyi]|uniref:MBD domain-containing protein n=1 Tax=Calicophoron daubneyi TaxID=300641 RepID=A0AAV2THB5_CALDB
MQNQTILGHHNGGQIKRNTCLNYAKAQGVAISNSPSRPILPMNLPPGWRREECMRQSGLDPGKTEVFYISPQGQKVRTKQEMRALLGDAYDMSQFDWRLGKFLMPAQKRRVDECGDSPTSKMPRSDNLLNPLIRRTNPPDNITPVIIRSHPECKRTDVRNPHQELPHQLFWEKRLTGLTAIDAETGEASKPLSLPVGVQSAGVPGYQPAQLVQSLVSAIATKASPITGQEQHRAAIEKNPCVAVNPLQPMIKTYIVTDEDIQRQEMRVKELRRKLEMARKRLHPRYSSEREG